MTLKGRMFWIDGSLEYGSAAFSLVRIIVVPCILLIAWDASENAVSFIIWGWSAVATLALKGYVKWIAAKSEFMFDTKFSFSAVYLFGNSSFKGFDWALKVLSVSLVVPSAVYFRNSSPNSFSAKAYSGYYDNVVLLKSAVWKCKVG